VTKLLRLVVLVSGSGSNLQAILDAISAGTLAADVLAVVSNRRGAYALERAELAGISTIYVPLKPYRTQGRPRTDYDTDLAELISRLSPDAVVCAGWMHIFSPAFLERVGCRVINLHPALPGEFPGKDAIGQAFAACQAGTTSRTGVMVHDVVAEVDAGPVLRSQEVPMWPSDDRKALEDRIHAVEHVLLVDTLRSLAAEQSSPAPGSPS
jgi:formyltetrahydrofolate-dependent phosphoribosylglycinamide formyltransferase